MQDFEPLQDQLTRKRASLPPILQQAATFLLEHPGEVATQSMRQVAAKSGVGLPNFSRLAKAMGFETYNELRDIYRQHVQTRTTAGYPERAGHLQSSGKISGDESVWASFRQSALDNIESVFARIDSQTIAAVADRLLEKETIHVVGMQASHPFVAYFQYVGGMVAPKIKPLGRRGGVIADDLIDMGPHDAVICLAIQPCARLTVQVAEQAFERGVHVVCITDSLASPLAPFGSDVLVTACKSPLFFESYIGAVAILELLIGFITLRAGPEAIERIKRIEIDRRRFGEYWVDPKHPANS